MMAASSLAALGWLAAALGAEGSRANWERLPYANDEARRWTNIAVAAYHSSLEAVKTLQATVDYRNDIWRLTQAGVPFSAKPVALKGWTRHRRGSDAYFLQQADTGQWRFGELRTPALEMKTICRPDQRLHGRLDRPVPSSHARDMSLSEVEFCHCMPAMLWPDFFRVIEEDLDSGLFVVKEVAAEEQPDGNVAWNLAVADHKMVVTLSQAEGYLPVKFVGFDKDGAVGTEMEWGWTKAGTPAVQVVKSFRCVGYFGKTRQRSVEVDAAFSNIKANEPIAERLFTPEGFGLPDKTFASDFRPSVPKDVILDGNVFRPVVPADLARLPVDQARALEGQFLGEAENAAAERRQYRYRMAAWLFAALVPAYLAVRFWLRRRAARNA